MLATSDGARNLYGLDRIGVEQGGAWRYPLPDALGSVRQWTDPAGAVLSAQSYGPFGEPRDPLSHPQVAAGTPPWGFAGEWQDAAGMVYLRARWYNSYLGRFVQPDTIAPDPGDPQSQNRFAYARNNPVRYVDPTGRYWDDEIKKYLQDTYGDEEEEWGSYWDAWQADPYWMWVLAQAQDDYVLHTGLGGNVTFRHKEGSFCLDKGSLRDYQGQGVYALYDTEMELVEDDQWLGYRTEEGLLTSIVRSGMDVYYQPLYRYRGPTPEFVEWRRINVGWSWKFEPGFQDAVPWVAVKLAKKYPILRTPVECFAVLSLINALLDAKADQVSYSTMAQWPPDAGARATDAAGHPVPAPVPNRWMWPNPNGPSYPPVPGR